MHLYVCVQVFPKVSLFTREWIEISFDKSKIVFKLSPSLRGSGLKLKLTLLSPRCAAVSLFTREWIEIEV